MPGRASSFAADVDWVFNFILWISIFFFVLITALMLFFVIRYRRRRGREPGKSASHNTALEITWSVIPVLLIVLIFWFGFTVFIDMATPPENSYEVLVTGQRWKWLFTYPNGYVDENLHVPLDTNVRLVMSSEDVIHSFFVPEFRVKRDVVPGRYSKAWFRATQAGQFDIYCAEYCGTSHSDMLATVIVHEPGGFEKWLEDASNFLDKLSPAEAGARLYQSRGCQGCHSVDGTANIGPTFKEIFGDDHALADGSSVTVDEDYIRESILEPQAKIVAGYQPVMPTYQGKLSDREITAIIEYIKTLNEEQ
jgi:cytochrome c oxidase subunit 2